MFSREMSEPKSYPGRLIDAKDLRFSYGSGETCHEVLHGISAVVRPGEIVMVTGPSGSGKTTFLTLLGALRRMQEGELTVLGVDLRNAGESTLCRLRQKFGFIFQSHNLLRALTAIQNVQLALSQAAGLSPEETVTRSRTLLEAVGMSDHIHKYPAHLSVGQCQRIAIARALAGRPRLIFADEPTASLDSVTGHEVLSLLHDLARKEGCGVIVVTHDHRILHFADRLLALEDGRLNEAHLGLARISEGLVSAAKLLPQLLRRSENADPLRQEINTLIQSQIQALDLWLGRSLSSYEVAQATLLRNRAEEIGSLADALETFKNARKPCVGFRSADASFEAIDAHLGMLVEQLEEPDETVLGTLLNATANGGRFAANYFRADSGVEEMELLLALMAATAQVMVYLHELLKGLAKECGAVSGK